MAFEVPAHLSRRAQTKEHSTIILEEIGESSWDTLTVAQSKQWLEELDAAIAGTTADIAERIKNAEEEYKSTLDTAQDVQQGMDALKSELQHLTKSLHDPQAGVLVNLSNALGAHGELSQQALDSLTAYEAASFFKSSNEHYHLIKQLLSQGKVTDVLSECQAFRQLTQAAPPPLSETIRFPDLVIRVREIESNTHEQIRLECEKSASVSQTFKGASLLVRRRILFKGSPRAVPFVDLLGILRDAEVEKQLNAFRDDILNLLVEPIIALPHHYRLEEVSGLDDSSELALKRVSHSHDTCCALDDLQRLVHFLNDYFVTQFTTDPTYIATFRHSLSGSLTSLVLSKLVQPSLPRSLQEVPSYLELAERATELENLINKKFASTHHSIHKWCELSERWYEESRVEELLARARDICESIRWDQVKVEAADEGESSPTPEDDNENEENWDVDDDRWGFNDHQEEYDNKGETSSNGKETAGTGDDSWGAWGDEEDEKPQPEPTPAPQKLASKPKSANRLEKLSAKARSSQTSYHDGEEIWAQPLASNKSPSVPLTPTALPSQPQEASGKKHESYMITTRATSILAHVEAVIHEAIILRDSDAFGKRSRPAKRGRMLFQSAPAACDMLRSFFPGVNQSRSPEEDIQLSCDFRHLNRKISSVYRSRIESNKGDFEPKEGDKWEETLEGLESAAEMCMQNAIDNQIFALSQILSGARGFRDTSEEMFFRRIESSVQEVLRTIFTAGHTWKAILSLTDYYHSLGSVIDAILLQIVDEIITLDDITEVESEKLADVCKQMEPVQKLFIDSDGESHVGTFVPSWFRFSYLKELLVASMADISYLFEQGMLLDYEVEELVKLLKALFADTPLRENTIRKVLGGHPAVA